MTADSLATWLTALLDDAVGQDDGDPLQAQQRLGRDEGAVKVLIDRLAPLVGVLADRNRKPRPILATNAKGASPYQARLPCCSNQIDQAAARVDAFAAGSRFGFVSTCVV